MSAIPQSVPPFQGVVYLDPEVANRAFELRVAQKKLHRPQVLPRRATLLGLGDRSGFWDCRGDVAQLTAEGRARR